ncbi:unnamed protein product [Lupinus luteus]|uniref:Peptidase A1 domain-containing protein n=1 Tax=Lupinus luteus TaxID=3873 RepID=A0AAV1WLV8_LUPLU
MNRFVYFATILFQLSISSSSAKPNVGLSVNLFHRNSPLSPYYNPSMNHSDYIINAAFHSISRVKRFNSTSFQNKAAQTIATESKGDYLMEIFVGTPPKKVIAIADTGSDLIWFQCSPCKDCYFQNYPYFDPTKSSTHHPVPCEEVTCEYLDSYSCGRAKECNYFMEYGDGSTSRGTLITDTVSFNNTYLGRIVKYPSILLGCGYHNKGLFSPNEEGIIGLGGDPLSLISQIGHQFGKRKFSYCFLPYGSERSSQIKFGVDTQTNRRNLVTTPLVRKFPYTLYYLSLERISVSGKMLMAKANETQGNIFIDSGTVLSALESYLFNKLKTAIIESIGKEHVPERYPPRPFNLCYRRIGNSMCLMIVPTNDTVSILGSYQQVYFNIEYDLDKRTVSFAPSNCK